MTATLGAGLLHVHLLPGPGQAVTSSAPVQVTGQGQTHRRHTVTVRELAGPNQAYQAYAAGQLATLAGAVRSIQADLRRGDLAAAQARTGWPLDWERVGASYDSFGARASR